MGEPQAQLPTLKALVTLLKQRRIFIRMLFSLLDPQLIFVLVIKNLVSNDLSV